MSFNFGQRIDSSNILFYFDAANQKCYTSGRTCNELIYNDIGTFDNVSSNQTQFVNSGLSSYLTYNGLDYTNFGTRISRLSPSFPLTIETWVKVGNNDNFNGVVSTDSRTSAYAGTTIQIFPFVIGSTYRIEAGFGNNLGVGSSNRRSFATSSSSEYLINQDTWNHIVAVFVNNNDIRIYINGVLIPGTYSGSATVPVWSGIGTLRFGYNWADRLPFIGDINSCIIWNRLMSNDEALLRYNSTKYRFGL
jgi:hypothetical protein